MSIEFAPREKEGRAICVAILLLVLQIGLLSFQIEDPSGALLFKRWALTAQAPFLNLSSNITDGIERIWQHYVWMVGARAENQQLHENVRRLSLLNGTYEQVRLENG